MFPRKGQESIEGEGSVVPTSIQRERRSGCSGEHVAA